MKSINRNYIAAILIVFSLSAINFGQTSTLRKKINGIIENADGKIGVAVINMEKPDTILFNGNGHFPMQSVFKFPLALTVLKDVDRGILSLEQKIHITKGNLLPNTWSPLRKKHPEGNFDITLRDLLTITVTESDNNGCDILLRLVGGPAKVNQFVHSLGIKDIEIVVNEEEMHKDWMIQYKNWSSPAAMAMLLSKFAKDSIISAASRNFLWNVMAATKTGTKMIKGLLPAGTIVVHKTGTSGENKDGFAAATNDAGIVALPNGRHFIIVVFVSDSREHENARYNIIAKISRAAWDAFKID